MNNQDSDDSENESFRVTKLHKKKSARAIIDSDSESDNDVADDDESFNVSSQSRSVNGDSLIEESDIEDSFDEEADMKELSKNLEETQIDDQLSGKNSSKENNACSSIDHIDTTHSEGNWESEVLTDDDLEGSSDGEDHDQAKVLDEEPKNKAKIVQNSGSQGKPINYAMAGSRQSVANTSLYRNTIIESSDDENNSEDDIIEDSDDELDSQQNKSSNKSPRVTAVQHISPIIAAVPSEKSLSVVELSSDEDSAQVNLKPVVIDPPATIMKPKPPANLPITATQQEPLNLKSELVTQEQYQQQKKKLNVLEAALLRAKNAMRVIKLENLPDRGKSLIEKEKSLNQMLLQERAKLINMTVRDQPPVGAREKVEVAWEEIEAGVGAVGPRTFGQKGVARFNMERQLAVETLDSLHKSLETCPTEKDFVNDPKGLKVPLMPHQQHALAWLLWREKQTPSGGLLADDMGLGKTLTMISLILKSRELHPNEDSEEETYRDKYPGGTLVVCPASLMNQWSGEIETRTKRGLLSVELYHGAKRETKAKRLAEHDVVITTYTLLSKDNDKNGVLFRVRWRRIILDEAHQIRNYKSQMAEAAFRLSGKSRWSLTGTPVHNKELDMYSILKFLRCAPFDDLQVWKRWMADKSTGGEMRLHAVISSLMKRRTKAELMEKGSLQSLPSRTWELIAIKLEKEEMDVYQKVLIFSRTLFAQFLHQRAEKVQDATDMKFSGMPRDPNGEYFKMRNKLLKLNRVKEVSQHEILVLLLRLRQICCHPSLIKQMLKGDEDLGDAEDYEQSEELNLLDQLNKLNINDDDEHHPSTGLSEGNVGLREASKGFLNPSHPVFRSDRPSSKIRALIKLVKEKVATGDKVIVVSQWTSLLDLIAYHIKDEGISFDSLNGKIQVHKRMPIVDNFNNPKSHTKVLLLSLTAGGVGLNLVGANHLFLLDLHWNPQLESQAQDRIYRMGQQKPIFVYKFLAEDTIEERIKALQDKKLEIANSMLTGSKRVSDNKLSLQDLKMLFDFK